MGRVACTVVPKRARHPATFLDMKRQLFKSLLQLSLGPAWLDAKRRIFLCRQLEFGSEAWAVFDQVVLPPLTESRDPVVLALRRLVTLDSEGLSPEHQYAFEKASLRPFGFLHLVLWEAIQVADLPPIPTPVRVYPLPVVLELINEEADQKKNEAWPLEFHDLTARALTAAAHRMIRQEAAEWRIALLQAWSEALRGTGEPSVFAALHAAYADGCELQGRHQEAAAIRQAIAERRGVLLPLDDDLH